MENILESKLTELLVKHFLYDVRKEVVVKGLKKIDEVEGDR